MGKTKNKNRSEVEFLRGEVKRLKRQVKALQKQSHFYEEVTEEISEEVELKETCPHCGKGEITILDLGLFKIEKCSLCDVKRRKK